jgi:hypothetical protein
MLKNFLSGFLSIFRVGQVSTKYVNTVDISEYFIKISQDISSSYKKMKIDHERK